MRDISINPLTLNDSYRCRTAPLTSKRCILYIYSTNIGTEYFKHGIYSPFLSLQNAVCFIILTYLVPVLFTFYIQDVLKLKKKSDAKRLIAKPFMVAFVITTFRCCCGETYDIKTVAQYCRPRFEPGACSFPTVIFFLIYRFFYLVHINLDFEGRKWTHPFFFVPCVQLFGVSTGEI